MRMKFKKTLAALAVVLLTVLGVQAVTTTPAAAAPACSNGWVCLYEHVGGGGNSYWTTGSYGTCQNLPAYWNDVASSVRNGMWMQVRLFQHSNCTGSSVGLSAECGGCLGSYINDLGGFPYFFNDTATSIRFY